MGLSGFGFRVYGFSRYGASGPGVLRITDGLANFGGHVALAQEMPKDSKFPYNIPKGSKVQI